MNSSITGAIRTKSAATNDNISVSDMSFSAQTVTGSGDLHVYTNDNSGAPAEVNLGSNFPITSGAMYELLLHCEPNSSAIQYYIRRIDSAQVAQGTLSSELPQATTLMAAQIGLHNGATAEVVGLDIVSMYYEMPL